MFVCFSPLLRAKAELEPFWKKSWFKFLTTLLAIIIVIVFIIYLFFPGVYSLGKNITYVNKSQPKFRVLSLATTNGDYFKKCSPAVVCNPDAKYRTYNGSCNNLENPSWGAAYTPFYRLINAEFDDGKNNQHKQNV